MILSEGGGKSDLYAPDDQLKTDLGLEDQVDFIGGRGSGGEGRYAAGAAAQIETQLDHLVNFKQHMTSQLEACCPRGMKLLEKQKMLVVEKQKLEMRGKAGGGAGRRAAENGKQKQKAESELAEVRAALEVRAARVADEKQNSENHRQKAENELAEARATLEVRTRELAEETGKAESRKQKAETELAEARAAIEAREQVLATELGKVESGKQRVESELAERRTALEGAGTDLTEEIGKIEARRQKAESDLRRRRRCGQ